MSFDKLPFELVQTVFECLKRRDLARCVSVNRNWNTLATPLLWKVLSLNIRPQAADPVVAGIKGGNIDLINLIHTKTLLLDLRFSMDEFDDDELGYPDDDEIEEWIFNCRLLGLLINPRRVPRLQKLALRVSEPDFDDSPTLSVERQNVRKRAFHCVHQELPKLVNDLGRSRDGLHVNISYDDALVQFPPPEFADLIDFLFVMGKNLVEVTIRSTQLGETWRYSKSAHPNLKHLTLIDRDWYCGTELQWKDFRYTKLESLVLYNYSLYTSLMLPETLTTIEIFGTGIPINALRISVYSLHNLRNVKIDQSGNQFDFEDWHHAELLSKPILSLGLQTLTLGKCLYHPQLVTRLAAECPTLQEVRFLLLEESSVIKHFAQSSTFSRLNDPLEGEYDYFHAFFRSFGRDVTHHIYVRGNPQSEETDRYWTLQRATIRQGVGKTFLKIVSGKIEMQTIREGQQELKEEANAKEMFWEIDGDID